MTARIYKPAKTAMQSGRAKTRQWRLEIEAKAARRIDPLMGWTSADETAPGQVRLAFDSLDEAVAYAERNKMVYRVIKDREPAMAAKAYLDNFAFHRRKPWTH